MPLRLREGVLASSSSWWQWRSERGGPYWASWRCESGDRGVWLCFWGRGHSTRSRYSSAKETRGRPPVAWQTCPLPLRHHSAFCPSHSRRLPRILHPHPPSQPVPLSAIQGCSFWVPGTSPAREDLRCGCLCEKVPVPGGDTVLGCQGCTLRMGSLCGDAPLAHPVPLAHRHEGFLCPKP